MGQVVIEKQFHKGWKVAPLLLVLAISLHSTTNLNHNIMGFMSVNISLYK